MTTATKATATTTMRNSQGEEFGIIDRAAKHYPYRKAARWAVWDVVRQVVVSEHATRKAAQVALIDATS